MFEDSNYTKLTEAQLDPKSLNALDEFLGCELAGGGLRLRPILPGKTSEEDEVRPGYLVLAPVVMDEKKFYWPAIVEFSPGPDVHYVKDEEEKDGETGLSKKYYFVTLITVERKAFYGSWVDAESLKPFNWLSCPQACEASHINAATEVFEYVKQHVFMSLRDRILRLSFLAFVAISRAIRRQEVIV
ncbi:uncharacterized protein LOC100906992 [Galendromus occidentalis]|uniref:Uncharacterized protein LOC100906992 n=1 Tax=Galendromus occidentalis TaxID=34638 RepID=A0AAJ7L5Z3_9ACAR|nr:uncharacterized protein LOC100906992 [Galendromus occidentalis]